MSNIDTITEDGEIVEQPLPLHEIGATVALSRAEIDMQIATAHAYPRLLKRVKAMILDVVTLDHEAAHESMYALPRAGVPVTGPSIRFAEAVMQAYGNCRAASRITEVNRIEKYVEAEGIFFDLQTNAAKKLTHRRRISGRNGRIFTDDMILITGNAAASIAMREAILKSVPKPLWREAFEAVVSIVKGDVKTLSERRKRAIAGFAAYGVTPEQIFARLKVDSELEVSIDHLPLLFGMYSAIKNGEETVENLFAPQVAVAAHDVVKDALADAITEPAAAASAPAQAADHVSELKEALEPKTAAASAEPAADDAPASEETPLTTLDKARALATNGRQVFDKWYNALSPEQTAELKAEMPTLMKVANAATAMARKKG